MKFLFFSFCLLSFFSVQAQDLNSLLADAAKTELIPNEGLALHKYKEILKTNPQNITVLSKCSELCSRIGSREKPGSNQDAWYHAALQYANKALSISPKSDEANVVKAMIIGKSSINKGSKEKIIGAKEIKKLLDVALASNPSNYLAWHILGRWNYEISNINSFERAAAKVFVGTIPQGSITNAIISFENARRLSSQFILNNIELAKAYHSNDQDVKAIALLEESLKMPVTTEDDPRLKIKARNFIKEWK